MKFPHCALCHAEILPTEAAFHKRGVPHVHAYHFDGMGDRYINPWASLMPEPADALGCAIGSTSPRATITNERRAPAEAGADEQEGDLKAGRRQGLAEINRVLRAAGINPRGVGSFMAVQALKVECPRCGAPAGERCSGKGLAHRERRLEARLALADAAKTRGRCGYGRATG